MYWHKSQRQMRDLVSTRDRTIRKLKREKEELQTECNRLYGIGQDLCTENATLKREKAGLLGIVSAYHPEYLRGCDCPQCSDAALLTAEEQTNDQN